MSFIKQSTHHQKIDFGLVNWLTENKQILWRLQCNTNFNWYKVHLVMNYLWSHTQTHTCTCTRTQTHNNNDHNNTTHFLILLPTEVVFSDRGNQQQVVSTLNIVLSLWNWQSQKQCNNCRWRKLAAQVFCLLEWQYLSNTSINSYSHIPAIINTDGLQVRQCSCSLVTQKGAYSAILQCLGSLSSSPIYTTKVAKPTKIPLHMHTKYL